MLQAEKSVVIELDTQQYSEEPDFLPINMSTNRFDDNVVVCVVVVVVVVVVMVLAMMLLILVIVLVQTVC